MGRFSCIVILCLRVVNVLGKGCTTITFSQNEDLDDCDGENLSGSDKFVTYDGWQINNYSDETVTPFNEFSTTYISPFELNKESCFLYKLKMLPGSQVYFNVFISEPPSALLYIKVFRQGGKEREEVDWSSIASKDLQELKWSTISITIPESKVSGLDYYTIAVVGTVRDTGILMIDSILYISSEFDGTCETYSDKYEEDKNLANLGTFYNTYGLAESFIYSNALDNFSNTYNDDVNSRYFLKSKRHRHPGQSTGIGHGPKIVNSFYTGITRHVFEFYRPTTIINGRLNKYNHRLRCDKDNTMVSNFLECSKAYRKVEEEMAARLEKFEDPRRTWRKESTEFMHDLQELHRLIQAKIKEKQDSLAFSQTQLTSELRLISLYEKDEVLKNYDSYLINITIMNITYQNLFKEIKEDPEIIISELTRNLTDVTAAYDAFMKTVSNYETYSQKLETRKNLEKLVHQKKNDSLTRQSEVNSLQLKLEQLENKINITKHEVASLNFKLNETALKRHQAIEEQRELRVKIDSMNTQITEKTEENNALLQEKSKVVAELSRLNDNIKIVDDKIEFMKIEIEDLEKNLKLCQETEKQANQDLKHEVLKEVNQKKKYNVMIQQLEKGLSDYGGIENYKILEALNDDLEKICKETNQTFTALKEIELKINEHENLIEMLHIQKKDLNIKIKLCKHQATNAHLALNKQIKIKYDIKKRTKKLIQDKIDMRKQKEKAHIEKRKRERERNELQRQQCENKIKTFGQKLEKDGEMYLWIALSMTLLILALLIFIAVFIVSQKLNLLTNINLPFAQII